MQGSSDPDRRLLDAAALCRQLLPAGSVEAFLADHRQRLFPDELFADLFPSGRGRPSIPADVVATVMVLQALEGLSDRDAARALTDRISWKVAAGLALDDAGFDYSVLTYWRSRLRRSGRPERIFEVVREVVSATGVLAGRTRRALDSTLLDDAVATQDTVTQLISVIRRARREIPAAAAVPVTAHDYDRAGKPTVAWDDPVAKQALISGLVNDALAILAAVGGADLDASQQATVGLLALVAGQDVEPGESEGTWRIAERVAPDRVISTVDPESRHMHKSRSVYRDGYKAHVAVEPTTGLITNADLTPANVGDGPVGAGLLAGEAPGLQVLADSAYGSGPTRTALTAAGHTQAIKPLPLRPAVPGGFTRDNFTIDHTARTVTCPAGHSVPIAPKGGASFGRRCDGCPLRSSCTTARHGMTLQVSDHDAQLVAARRAWRDGTFIDDYRQWRPMVERSLAWTVADGWRRLRYHGVARNRQALLTRIAAINLRRLVNLGLTHTDRWALNA
ncbi:IS1182 family transposase [Acidimicrobiaceae bacterium USS-CC1]|uniref:IS1182 family transposase n=1 Tax=Acidiferrimicrobium australe TaxID=2664430 RepID=A0ABW9R1Q3_9ACTN|nr:IS1182 family transposase [Acidiferrimicrobium australe]